MSKTNFTALKEHPTKREQIIRYVLLLGILTSYFVYLSFKYGAATSFGVSLLTWSFFVLCTPVADGGFLIDLPLRLLMGWRMLVSEIAVWGMALSINAYFHFFDPALYETTLLTSLLHKIVITPWPYWGIIFLSGIGTFLSIKFGDELLDKTHHKDCTYQHKHAFKHNTLVMIVLFILIVVAYYHLLDQLGIVLPK